MAKELARAIVEAAQQQPVRTLYLLGNSENPPDFHSFLPHVYEVRVFPPCSVQMRHRARFYRLRMRRPAAPPAAAAAAGQEPAAQGRASGRTHGDHIERVPGAVVECDVAAADIEALCAWGFFRWLGASLLLAPASRAACVCARPLIILVERSHSLPIPSYIE